MRLQSHGLRNIFITRAPRAPLRLSRVVADGKTGLMDTLPPERGSSDVFWLALKVNDLLSAYVAVHDDVFQPWWRSIPIPFLFRPIHFGRAFVRLSLVKGDLEECRRELGGAQPEPFIVSLSAYVEALLDTVDQLLRLSARLAEKSHGSAYEPPEYRRDLADYDRSVRLYLGKGAELNEVARELGLR